jgi:hypothetical protein
MLCSDENYRGPLQKRDVGFNFGSEITRGVNIGGWLILEPYVLPLFAPFTHCLIRYRCRWITPSLFEPLDASVVDEYTLCKNVPNAKSILKSHWDTWVTIADFQKIAEPVSIPSEYQLVIERIRNILVTHTSKVQHLILMPRLTGPDRLV